MTRSMHSSRWIFHPLLASIYPVLSLFAQNYDEASITDVVPCLIVSALFGGTLLIALRVLFRNWQSGSLAATFLVGSTYFYHFFALTLTRLLSRISIQADNNLISNIVWLGIVLLGVGWIWRKRSNLDLLSNFNRLITYVACLMVVMVTASLILKSNSNRPETSPAQSSASSSVSENNSASSPHREEHPQGPLQGQVKFSADSIPPQNAYPDVFYLVFDRYGGLDSIQKSYDYDNTNFFEELTKRGFSIAKQSRSNYPKTNLSMASALNMRMLTNQVESYSQYRQAILTHQVGKIFSDLGYQYYHYGNSYGPLRRNNTAHYNFPLSFFPSEFADALFEMTPFPTLINTRKKYDFVRSKMHALAELSKQESPTFAYAHFLVPHNPYAFRSDGSCATLYYRKMCNPRDAYIEQLIATNAMILTLVDEIIANSKTPPIIILQADEGPYLSSSDSTATRQEQIQKRTSILSAFYCPNVDMNSVFPKNITPVNTFRFIFKECFQAPIELLPNRTFYWEQANDLGLPAEEGTKILDVTDLLIQAKR